MRWWIYFYIVCIFFSLSLLSLSLHSVSPPTIITPSWFMYSAGFYAGGNCTAKLSTNNNNCQIHSCVGCFRCSWNLIGRRTRARSDKTMNIIKWYRRDEWTGCIKLYVCHGECSNVIEILHFAVHFFFVFSDGLSFLTVNTPRRQSVKTDWDSQGVTVLFTRTSSNFTLVTAFLHFIPKG